MKNSNFVTGAILSSLLFLGCSSVKDITQDTNHETVDYSYELSAAFNQKLQSRAAENVIAEMEITDEILGSSQLLDWHVTIDEDVVSISSIMTHAVSPSTYSFALSVNKGNHTYVGSASNDYI